jgi:hypothetical protein
MEPARRKHQSIRDPAAPAPSGKPVLRGILLSRDLIFTTKVTETAAALGYRIEVADDQMRADTLIQTAQPRVVFVDLTAGKMTSQGALKTYLELASPDVWFVAFGPHVEADTLAAAKAVGCHVVLPRSKFAAELPELLRRYFSTRASDRH